jgi:hypothetical protein
VNGRRTNTTSQIAIDLCRNLMAALLSLSKGQAIALRSRKNRINNSPRSRSWSSWTRVYGDGGPASMCDLQISVSIL